MFLASSLVIRFRALRSRIVRLFASPGVSNFSAAMRKDLISAGLLFPMNAKIDSLEEMNLCRVSRILGQ